MTRAAVFFDRDGVLNPAVMRGDVVSSPRALDEFHIDPDAASVVRALQQHDLRCFVVTNQPDISRGLLAPDALAAMHQQLRAQCAFDDIVVCPHDNHDRCTCRKPQPGMLQTLAAPWNICLKRSWMVGDQARDIGCARAAGCRGILLDRPYNIDVTDADVRLNTLADVVPYVLRHLTKESS